MKNFYLFGKLTIPHETLYAVGEIGVNFVGPETATKKLNGVDLYCKFHPDLLDLLDQLGVTYNKLTEIPLGTVFKEITVHKDASLVSLWDKENPFIQQYSTEIGREYEMPYGTMGFFFTEDSKQFRQEFAKVLDCEIDGFFYFPMWVFPINGIGKRYADFKKRNSNIEIPKIVPTPNNCNFRTDYSLSVVPALPKTVCAYKFKVIGTRGLYL